MTSSKPNALELAKQGNPKAIAALINKSLSDKAITVSSIKQDGGVLKIELKSPNPPIEIAILERIKLGAIKLGVESVEKVEVLESKPPKLSPRMPVKQTSAKREAISNGHKTASNKDSRKPSKTFTDKFLSSKWLIPSGLGALLVLVLPIAFLISGFSRVCKVEGEPAYQVLDRLNAQWDDAEELAFSTSRVALSNQIRDLQGIKQEAESISWSGCSETAANLMINSMESTIQGFIHFLDPDKPESIVEEEFDNAQSYSNDYYQEYVSLLPRKQRIQEEREQAQINARAALGLIESEQLLAITEDKDFIQNFDDLSGNIPKIINDNDAYEFSVIEADAENMIVISRAQKRNLVSYAFGATSVDGSYKSIICESKKPSKSIEPPKLLGNTWKCASDSDEAI